jgi:putative redox protein
MARLKAAEWQDAGRGRLAYSQDMVKRVTARWDGELDFEGADEAGATVSMSQSDEAFGPASLVLAALAGCTGMDVVSIMGKKQVGFDAYRVEVEAEQRRDYPRLFTRITVVHIVAGANIEDEAVARSIELSARKYCVVGASLASGDAEIRHRMRITDERGERSGECLTIGPQSKGLSHDEDA